MEQDPQKRKVSIGAVLVDARNRVALSQVEVAAQMNLAVGVIKALEEDDFENLPESTYVRGYLRMYARITGMDSGHLIRIYDEQHYVEPEYHDEPGHHVSLHPNMGRKAAILWGVAAVLAILAGSLVIWQVYDATRQSVPIAKSLDDQSEPVLSDQSPALEISGEEVSDVGQAGLRPEEDPAPVIPEHQASQEHPDSALTAEGTQAVENKPGEGDPAVSDDGLDVLKVTYTQRSWTEIRDVRSQLLMWDLVESGAIIEIRGKAPFDVLLGNSQGVVLEVNGQRFDHSRFIMSDRTARFKVSSSLLD